MIILDTNVLSELLRGHPNPSVLAWSRREHQYRFATTAVSEAELRLGVAYLPIGRRRTALAKSVERVLDEALGGRVEPFDRFAAWHYAAFMAARRAAGRPVQIADAMIAGIGLAAGAQALATRNTRDFEGCGLALIDPWHQT